MSIHAISGKPGGGKSLFGMKALVTELRTTHRYVVTNLAVKQPELASYLHKLYGQTFDLNQRLTILDEEQTAKFWLYRGNGMVLPDREKNDFSTADASNVYYVPDYQGRCLLDVNGQTLPMRQGGGEGVCFILDELHLFFNAREWAKTGKAAIFYLSQHRKCNNDVVWITQHIENVDKQFRSLTQDFTYLRNYRQEKFMSAFQSLPWFGFKTFQSPVTATSALVAPTESGRFLLDAKGLAACYDTAKGVGFAGNVAADTQKPRRGLPMWVFILLCLGLCIAAPLLLIGVTHFVSNTVAFRPGKVLGGLSRTNASHVLKPAAVAETNTAPAVLVPVAAPSPFTSENLLAMPPRPRSDTNELSMTGFARVPGKGFYVVLLSDGRMLRSDRREVVLIDENRCIVDGALVYRRWTPPQPVATAASIAPPAQFRAPVPVEYPSSGVDTRMRQLTIHYADGSTITKLVEPASQPTRSESDPEAEQPFAPADVPNYPPQPSGNGLRNNVPRSRPNAFP